MSATGRVAAATGSALYMGDGKDSVGSAYSNSSVCISLSIFIILMEAKFKKIFLTDK